jgi:hypothetical protein
MTLTSPSNGSRDDTVVEDADTSDRRMGSPAAAGNGQVGRSGLTAQQKKILAVVLVVHLILAKLTWLDLRRRPAAAVRGPKRFWRVWATFNTTGSLAYWTVGRRRRTQSAEA